MNQSANSQSKHSSGKCSRFIWLPGVALPPERGSCSQEWTHPVAATVKHSSKGCLSLSLFLFLHPQHLGNIEHSLIWPKGGAIEPVWDNECYFIRHLCPSSERKSLHAQLVNWSELLVGEVWGFPELVEERLPIQSGDIVLTGPCCYSWSFTAEITQNTNTLNFYLQSICTHALDFLDCVMPCDVGASWLQLFLPALSLWREIQLPGGSLLCAPLRLVKSNNLSSSWEKTSELRLPLVWSSLSSPAIPLILFSFRDFVYACVCIRVCSADLRLWHEGRGLQLRAVSTGEVLQRKIRNLSTAQRLPRPLQGHGPCSRDPGERLRVRTLFTWVSHGNTQRWPDGLQNNL